MKHGETCGASLSFCGLLFWAISRTWDGEQAVGVCGTKVLTFCLFAGASAHSVEGWASGMCQRMSRALSSLRAESLHITVERFEWRANAWQPKTLGHRGAGCLAAIGCSLWHRQLPETMASLASLLCFLCLSGCLTACSACLTHGLLSELGL